MDWRILPLGRSDWLAGRFRSGYVEGVWGRVAYVFLLFVFFLCVFFFVCFFFVLFFFVFGKGAGPTDRSIGKRQKKRKENTTDADIERRRRRGALNCNWE